MKKTLAIALASVAMVSTAVAQQSVQPFMLPLVDKTKSVGEPKHDNLGKVADEHRYRLFSRVLSRFGRSGDTNRRDLTVPLDLGGTEMRGFGQILPGPTHFYSLFSGRIYNANGQIINVVDTSFENDQEYVDQFKNATKYTVDGFSMPFFKNPYGPSQNGGLLTLYKTKYNFRSNAYKSQGFSSGRSLLTVVRELEFSPEAIDTTLQVNDTGDTLINPTEVIMQGDPGTPTEPISLAADESLIVLFTNEFAPAVTQPVAQYDTREFERVLGSEEYREGDVYEDPDNPGTFIDDRKNPIDSFLCFGAVMFRANGKDSVYSAWRALVFGSGADQKRAIMNLGMTFIGSVEVGASGVKYHFGKDAEAQGIGTIGPNPVRENTTIPFALARNNDVRIDLFDSRGELVKNVLSSHFVRGSYTVPLSTEGLANGIYMVRMITGDNVYSSKISVSR